MTKDFILLKETMFGCDTMKKKVLIISIILIVILTTVVIFMVNKPEQNLGQPLISPENENETLIEEEVDVEEEPEDEAETEEVEKNSLSDKISVAIQKTVDKVFSRQVDIVAIGDSLTQGVGDETEGGGYVGILERSINQEREVASFDNFGVPGNRTDHLLKRLEKPEIQEGLKEAELVLITIGANDIMQVAKENITNLMIDDFVAERDLYEARLRAVLDRIQEINGNAEIYLVGIYNPFENYFGDIAELDMIVEAWNETGSTIALEEENITFIPVIDLFTDAEENLFSEDNFHPNYEGYYIISERVLEYITEKDDQDV